jgi:hypothetical protein
MYVCVYARARIRVVCACQITKGVVLRALAHYRTKVRCCWSTHLLEVVTSPHVDQDHATRRQVSRCVQCPRQWDEQLLAIAPISQRIQRACGRSVLFLSCLELLQAAREVADFLQRRERADEQTSESESESERASD